MSDYRAIAAVTGTLQQFLYSPLSAAVPGTTVRTGPPSAGLMTGAAGAANIFLYQVNPNPAWRNAELPVRRPDGSVIRTPQAALDLYYLISFYGAESKMVPQLLLGAAVAALHAEPRPKASSIPETLDGKSLEACGLREQVEVLKFTMIPLSHEELARIWSVFFQVPYALSLAYLCSVVLLEADLTPEPALPVRATSLRAVPWVPARLERIEPQVLEAATDAVVRIGGTGLEGSDLAVRFDDESVAPQSVADAEVEARLPVGLAAGVHSVRVVRGGTESNSLPLTLLPRIDGAAEILEDGVAASADRADDENGTETRLIRVPVSPSVSPGQRAELLLFRWPGEVDGAPGRSSYKLRAVGESVGGRFVDFPLRDVPAGDYLAQVAVDQATSRLSTDDDATSADFGKYTGPRLTIP